MSVELSPTEASARALADTLTDLARLVDELPDADYVWLPPSGRSGSIGGHVRHCLDHVEAVLHASDTGTLCYDNRQRDTAVEHDRKTGVGRLLAASARLRAVGRSGAGLCVLEALLDRGGRRVRLGTSIARELVFTLQHTIHHQAIIGLLLAARGAAVPGDFGYAPSTPRSPADACPPSVSATVAVACAR